MTEMLITIITSLSTAAIAWFFARRKNLAEARKSEAEAKTSELEVIENAIKIWREIAEDLKKEVQRLSEDNKALKCEVSRLRYINNKILQALDKMTKDNIEQIVGQIKNEINNESKT